MEKKKKVIYLALGILSLIMLAILIISFVFGEPPFEITKNMIYIFVIIAILLVFDSIESLNIGNVITLKSKVKDKEKEIAKLSDENFQLRNQFVSVIKTTFNNQSSNQIIIGDKALTVQKADNDEVAKEREENEVQENQVTNPTNTPTNRINRVKLYRENEAFLLESFINQNDFSDCIVQRDIKITTIANKTDHIIDRDTMFDAYIKSPKEELFVEVLSSGGIYNVNDFRLYFMISRVYHYSRTNQTNAKVVVVLPHFSEECLNEDNAFSRSPHHNPNDVIRRLNITYAPAIKNDLLEVVEIDVSKKDLEQLEKKANV